MVNQNIAKALVLIHGAKQRTPAMKPQITPPKCAAQSIKGTKLKANTTTTEHSDCDNCSIRTLRKGKGG